VTIKAKAVKKNNARRSSMNTIRGVLLLALCLVCSLRAAEKPNPSALLRVRKPLLSYDGEVNRYASSHTYDKKPQLFDLIADPHEKKNLAEANPEVAGELAKAIKGWYPLKTAKVLR